MKKLNFSININASRKKVWDVLLGEKTYPEWTSVFAPDSSVETDWQEGSKALFHDGKGNGMVSIIEKNIPNEYLSIKHLGIIENGVEDTTSDKVKPWAGSMENYILKDNNGETQLMIEMDTAEEYADYFNKTWPSALEKVKELSKGND
jgi:hypothetical protein